MSLQLILEASKEARRLVIAGSPLAVGDFRLKKLVGPLEQAGAKVPVFGQVARAITTVVDGTEADSAANLLNLGTLLNAILHTQGQTGSAGDFRELDPAPSSNLGTPASHRALKPLVQALTRTGGGRFETVKAAVDQGAFQDLRLIEPAIQALGDSYPELAELIADKVLPAFGPIVLPRLKAGFDIGGKRQDARRLHVMHRIDPVGTLDLCKRALEDGSAAVKEAAIVCLGAHAECVPLVIAQLKGRNETLRAAALEALAQQDHPDAVAVLEGMIRGQSSLAVLVAPFQRLKSKRVLLTALEEAARLRDLLKKGDRSHADRFRELLDCLGGRVEAETETEDFLLSCLDEPGTIAAFDALHTPASGGDSILHRVASLVYRLRTPRALGAILAHWDRLPAEVFPLVIRSAVQLWSPQAVFEAFSPFFPKPKAKERNKERGDDLERFILATRQEPDAGSIYVIGGAIVEMDQEDTRDSRLRSTQWDERWLDTAILADRRAVVCALARPNHPGAIAYLLKQGGAKNALESALLVRALIRCEYPSLTDFFLAVVGKKCGATKYYDYEIQALFDLAGRLPQADLPRLEEFATKLGAQFTDRFLEALTPLRASKQTQTES